MVWLFNWLDTEIQPYYADGQANVGSHLRMRPIGEGFLQGSLNFHLRVT